MKELTIGVFAVTLIHVPTGRWKVRNTLTTFEHVTYGSEAEVVKQLEVQSKAWQAKFAPIQKVKQRGSAWRQKQSVEFAEAHQDKKTG
jgi:hypothetical protein